jgi:tetratricopeptide (TPR) repeat protein
MAALYSFKGDINRSKDLYEESLIIFKEFGNKERMAIVLGNIGGCNLDRGDIDSALECLEQSVTLFYESGNLRQAVAITDTLIQILVEKGDIKQAEKYLQDMEHLNHQLKDNDIKLRILFDKALLLKTSSRAINRGKAEELFKQVLDGAGEDLQLIVIVLYNLCELLLTELRLTNDLEVLDEIKPLIAKLLNIAEKSNSHTILCETYLLQAKLSLLTFDIKKARRYLTQAKQIADRFDLVHLSEKIGEENSDLLKKVDLWQKLKETGASMAERIDLAQLNQQIAGLTKKSADLTVKVTEEDMEIQKEKKICLVCRGEVLGFSYICECAVVYCENCARAIMKLENVCWACNSPLDTLKPVKTVDKEKKKEISDERGRKN